MTGFALAGSLFPQSFAYARQVLQRDDPKHAAMGISTLRTVFSLAWVAGPPLAALLLEAGGFRYLYGVAAILYALAAVVAIRWMVEIKDPATPAGEDEPLARRPWMAWLASIANQLGLSMDEAFARYASGCPKCSTAPCTCSF